MCPPPCGSRRRSSYTVCIKSETITKKEVEQLILDGKYSCETRIGQNSVNQPYEGCLENLVRILHDGKTRVKVVGSRCRDYRFGFRTVVMTAACFPAVFIFRKKM